MAFSNSLIKTSDIRSEQIAMNEKRNFISNASPFIQGNHIVQPKINNRNW